MGGGAVTTDVGADLRVCPLGLACCPNGRAR